MEVEFLGERINKGQIMSDSIMNWTQFYNNFEKI